MIREWNFEDLPQIEALEKECFPSGAWTRQNLAESFLSEQFCGVLLEEAGAITAYGGVSYLFDEGEIQLIATAENYRRCGRGEQILQRLIDEAKKRGVKKLYLEVRVSNAPAMSLYLKYGFVGLHARSRYYPDGEDALVMKKEII